MSKVNKIPKTYRLPEITIEQIQQIRESFLKDGMQLSSDSAVISYAVSNSLALCKSVDNGYITLELEKEEILLLLNWFRTSTQNTPKEYQQSLKLKDKLKWSIE